MQHQTDVGIERREEHASSTSSRITAAAAALALLDRRRCTGAVGIGDDRIDDDAQHGIYKRFARRITHRRLCWGAQSNRTRHERIERNNHKTP